MARDSVDAFVVRRSAVEGRYVAVEPKCRSHVRKGKVARKGVAELDLTQFETSVPLIRRGRLRGKNPLRAES